MEDTITRWRFTVHDYHRMAEAGIIGEDDPIELIKGELITMAAAGGPHIRVTNRLNAIFSAAGDEIEVSIQNPPRLSEDTEPEPDLVVLRRPAGGEPDEVPEAKDALLVIEVAVSSLAYDRETKLHLYAEAGIPETCIANVPGACFEVHRDPLMGVYQTEFVVERGQTLSPAAFPDVVLDVTAILGE